jgi:hypothetical protein
MILPQKAPSVNAFWDFSSINFYFLRFAQRENGFFVQYVYTNRFRSMREGALSNRCFCLPALLRRAYKNCPAKWRGSEITFYNVIYFYSGISLPSCEQPW